MGIGYRINPDLGLTVEVWDGVITPEECRHHLIELAEDTRWPPGRLEIIDLTTLRDLSRSPIRNLSMSWLKAPIC